MDRRAPSVSSEFPLEFPDYGSQRFIIVAPTVGLPGFGQEWLEEISGDYGGQNMKDCSLPSMRWQKSLMWIKIIWVLWVQVMAASRFIGLPDITTTVSKLLSHMPESSTLNSKPSRDQEMWFANWDLGGAQWDKTMPFAQKTYQFRISSWTNGIRRFSITHGELDYRILTDRAWARSMQPSFVGYRPRCWSSGWMFHWIAQPQNGVLFPTCLLPLAGSLAEAAKVRHRKLKNKSISSD